MTKVCQDAFVRKEPCINGKRNVKITSYLKENGKCRPFQSRASLYCESEKKQFCKCNVVDNLHYRTYDGQSIHFSGGCRYALTQYNGGGDSCSFSIEIQNEYRDKNKHLTHTKSVIIHMFGKKFELGQHKTLKIGNIQRSIPYEKGEDVRIFHSNNVVQFVAPKCLVHVAFDERSNAFIEVSKRYSKKMNGICGNCNGIEDDLKTKSGKDVSKKRDKYSRIANSYKVIDPGKYCKSAEHISYRSLCRRSFIESANSRHLCSAIISRNSPFRQCGQQAHVDLRNFYEDCIMDMCVNKNRRQNPQRVQCKILGVLSEVCAESGIPGIKWRTHFNCPKKCGENEHFTRKASPCPSTCENHFFRTQRPCYDLPEIEGCECNIGYIRDGSLCVKPKHCNCINLCTDSKGSENCIKWKARGDCEKFKEPMNIMCRKTCDFCKSRALSCENEISTKQCLLFRQQGLCFDEFYRSICGLTCNPDKCKCSPNRVIVGKCNERNITTTTHYNYVRDSNGECVQIVKQTRSLCGCPPSWTDSGICNYCTGKLNITSYSYEPVKLKCVLRINTRHDNCPKCPENAREQRNCVDDKYLTTTVYFNRLNGCFQCFSDQRISTTEIECITTKDVKMVDQTTECTTIYKRTLLNCHCRTDIIYKCCPIKCPRSTTTKTCENGRFVYRTLSYKLADCKCDSLHSYKIEIPKCQPRKYEYGKCIKKKNGSLHYYLTVTKYSENVNANCKCVRKISKHKRICRCGEPREYKKCNKKTGMLSTFYVTYHLVKRGKYFRCDEKISVSSVLINFPTQFIERIGRCKSDLTCTITIYRKFRDGCEIRTMFYKKEERICGCHNITRDICEFGRRIIRQYKPEFVKFQCVQKLISEKEFPIICPNDQINKTKCYYGKQTVTTTSYYKLDCKCIKTVDTKIKECICPERVISKKILKCNLKTRKQIHITVSINEECFHEQLVCVYVCICPPPITRSHCCPITGLITTTTETFYLVEKKSKCPSKLVSTIMEINCNNVKVIKQKCGQERNYYQKITTIRQILLKEICRCKTIKTRIWKCCKLPESTNRTLCKGNYFSIEVVKYKFDQHGIECIRQTSYHTKRIKCPPIKVLFKTTNLPKCRYKQTRFYYSIQNCKCELREHSEIYYKCCLPRQPTVTCVDNTKLVTTFTTCHLSSDRKQRRKYVRKVVRNIICPKSKVTRTIIINNCLIHIITDYYRVENCKCEMHTEVVKRPICCKIPQINITCLANKIWRVTTTKYKNGNDGECINQTSFVDNVKKCPAPYCYVCPCSRNRKLKSIKCHFYVTVNCQCEHRINLIPCPCHKIPNKIIFGSCKPTNMNIIKIFRSVNVNDNDCQWKLLESYRDVCRCPNNTSIKTCVQHSIYRTITIKYKRVKVPSQYPKHKCVKSQIVTNKIIECNKNYNYYGNCINYKKPLTQCVYRSINCKCELSCNITHFTPCDCQKLDNCTTTCIRNAKYDICHKHKSGPSRCIVYFTSRIPIVEKCTSKTSTRCINLNYLMNNCYYKSCETSFYVYQDCRCVKRTETPITCIRCRKPIIRIRCIHNRRVMKITNFINRHNRCHPVQYEKIINIECPRWKAIQTKRHGYIHYKITYYKIHNCKCIPWTCHGPYFKKKCPSSKSKRRCSRNNQWVYTKIVRQIHFTHRRICPEAGSPFREQICIENRKTRIEPIKCPFSYEIITCIVLKNIKITEEHYYKVVNCQCEKSVSTKRTRPCRACRKPYIRESPCGPLDVNGIGYIQITTRYWELTRKNTCKPRIKKSQRIGCCRPSLSVNECVNGKKVFKTFNYEVVAQCKPRITIISESVPCYNNGRPNKWRIERIRYCRRPGGYTVKDLERMEFNATTCGCRRVRKSVKIDICCRPCQYGTVCRYNNIFVTISHCQRPYKLKCLNYTTEKNVVLKCPKPVKRVIGDCKGRVIRYRIVSYKSIRCRCVRMVKEYTQRKIRDVTECINEMWRTTHIGYEFYRNRCVPKQPIITFRQIFCSTVQTFKDKRINNCDFSRSYFKKIISNCRCVDKLVRKEILHYKCCKKPIVSKTCVKHNTRVIAVTNFNLVNFKCYPVRRETRFTVDCPHLKLQDRIQTSLCIFKIVYYYAATKNCACYRTYKFTYYNLNNCCDHLIPYKEQKCDKERGRLINIMYSYKLVIQSCPKIRSITYTPINCDGQICERRYGKCIRNTQTIELFCLKRQRCKCVKKLFRSFNVCCGPRKDSTWTNIGECGEIRKYYERIFTYAFKLHYITNRCVPIVIKQQYKICRCPDSFVRKSCFNNINIITRTFSYKINIPKNVCPERIDESVSLVSRCYKTFNITMNERETTPDGWCIRTNKIITPVNCKCLERIEENRFWCPCYKPVPVKIIKYCRNNNIITVETHFPICRLYNIYWKIVTTSTPILNCSHQQTLYSDTFHCSWYRNRKKILLGFDNRVKNEGETNFCTRTRFETHLQWYVDNCVCKHKIIKERLVCIECLPQHQEEICSVPNNIIVISYSHPILNGICRRNVNRRIIKVPCPKQPRIVISRCINNKFTITKTNYFYDNCRCRSTVETKTCDCRCNRNSKVTKCSRNYFFNEVTTTYQRNNCRCFKTEIRKQIEPSCHRFVSLSFGKCRIKRRHSIYRKITRRHIRKDYRNCKCRVVGNSENKVCDCVKETRKRQVCINNNFVIQTWGWRINFRKNRCGKVILNTNVNVISCPPPSIVGVCIYNIRRIKVTTIKYELINCKCVEKRSVKRIPCPCNEVLDHIGECRRNGKGHLISIYTYLRKEARGKHCVTVKVRKPVRCCLPDKYSKFCLDNRFVHVNITYKLVNNRCRRKNLARYEYVRCSKHIERVETGCYTYGYKYIMFYAQTVHNCKCVRRRIRLQFCRCRCPRNRTFRRCDRSGKALINIHFTYKHVGCFCTMKVTRNIQRIQCPSSNEIVSKCNEVRCKGYWFQTRKVTHYQSRHCICVPIVKTTKTICRVEEFKQVSTSCDIMKKLEIRKESRLVFKEGKCVKVIKEKRIPITCNNRWFLVNRPKCYFYGLYGTEFRIYNRWIFKTCRCHLQRKFKRCDCRCTGPSVSRKCEGNIIYKYKYQYQYELNRCKCIRKQIKMETERIHCKSKISKSSSCFKKANRCVKNVEYREFILSNCQCIERRRTVEMSCHSCCDGSSSTRKYCNELLNKFITKITGCSVDHHGHIHRNSQVTSQGITCEVGTICVSKSGCIHSTSTETLKCTITTLEKCLCVSKTEIIKRDSCVCALPKQEYDMCKKSSCTRTVYQIESKLLVLQNNNKTCVESKKKVKDEICCCPNSNVTRQCINNRLIRNIETYTFNEAKKTCDSRTNEGDVTENCEPATEKLTGSCDWTTLKRKVKIIMRQLIECKCKTTENIETELCRCPEDRSETRCVENKLETTVYKYNLNNEKKKCIMTIDNSSKEIECLASDTESLKFDINDLEQCRKIVYKVQNCQCTSVNTPQQCQCSLNCPQDTVTESCIPEKRVFRIVNKKYKFDRAGCKCNEDIKTEDKQIKCVETPRNEISKAGIVYENGIYDSVTTHIERRDNCECIKQSSTKFVLNKCFDNYKQSRSQNDLYDYKCEKIPKPSSQPQPCPNNSTNSFSNGTSEVTYYIIKDNKCEKQTTVVTCNECKIQYCAEESSSCDLSKCSDESVRATCPIKCGICEPCPSTARSCETNPFDNKQYRRKEE